MKRAFTPNLWVSCYTACWDCRFGFCSRNWHSKADPDNVLDFELGYLPTDPRLQQCGCWCQYYEPRQLIHKGRKP